MSGPNVRSQRFNSDVRTLLILLAVLLVAFAIALPGEFLTLANFQSMSFQLPELGILAIAMAIAMLTGGINLSIIATANACGIVIATVLTRAVPSGASVAATIGPLILSIAAGLSVAAAIGAANGFIITYLGVSPILATLGTMTMVEGISILATRGRVISGFPTALLAIGNETVFGVPAPLIIFAIAAWAISVLLERTPFGLSVYMIGSNQVATEFSGVNVRRVIMRLYVLSGVLCGIASVIMISRFNSAKAGYAASYQLITVLACVLGGINPDGGFGRIIGLVLSLVILQMVSSGLNLSGSSAHMTVALWGAIILVISLVRQIGRSRSDGVHPGRRRKSVSRTR